eukprot:COSAG01_NODE_4667_length_4834_cov_23.607814_2_plen_144_part_00
MPCAILHGVAGELRRRRRRVEGQYFFLHVALAGSVLLCCCWCVSDLRRRRCGPRLWSSAVGRAAGGCGVRPPLQMSAAEEVEVTGQSRKLALMWVKHMWHGPIDRSSQQLQESALQQTRPARPVPRPLPTPPRAGHVVAECAR